VTSHTPNVEFVVLNFDNQTIARYVNRVCTNRARVHDGPLTAADEADIQGFRTNPLAHTHAAQPPKTA